jgi:hypothetical protein
MVDLESPLLGVGRYHIQHSLKFDRRPRQKNNIISIKHKRNATTQHPDTQTHITKSLVKAVDVNSIKERGENGTLWNTNLRLKLLS